MPAKTAKKKIQKSSKKPAVAKSKAAVKSVSPKKVFASAKGAKKTIAPLKSKKATAPKKAAVKATPKKSVPKQIVKKSPKKTPPNKKAVKKIGSISKGVSAKPISPKKTIKKISEKEKVKIAPKTPTAKKPLKNIVKKNDKQTSKPTAKKAAVKTSIPAKGASKVAKPTGAAKPVVGAKSIKATAKADVAQKSTSKISADKKSSAKAVSSKRSAEPKPILDRVLADIESASKAHSKLKHESGHKTSHTAPQRSSGQAQAETPKKRMKHVRPSESIAFSLEDLDSFFDRKEHGVSVAPSKEVDVLKRKKTAEVSDKSPVVSKAVAAQTPPPSANRTPLAPASIFDILGFNPVEAPTREKHEEKDIPRKWKKYYTQLIELRNHHSSGVAARSEEVLKRSVKEDSGDLSSYGQHLADAGSESFERDMAYNILSNEKEILAEIDEAIKRIKNGTYGICEVTGNPIPEERLAAIPFTRFTKEGQERKELEQRRLKANQRNLYDIPETAGGEDE